MFYKVEFNSESEDFIFTSPSEPFPVSPSEKGLEALQKKMEECLSSTCKPLFYIAPIPCGGGKTTAVQTFIRNWKARGFDGDGSVIIMLPTLEEIDTYVKSCGLDLTDYACLSPHQKYARYGLGRGKAGQAKVLFVTHEQARRRMIEAGAFEPVAEFHYREKPRSLRLVDEGLTPAIPVSIKLSALEALVDAIGARNRSLAEKIDGLRLDNKDRVLGHKLFIPMELGQAAMKFAFGAKDWMSKDHVRALEGLGYLAGRWAVLRRDNRYEGAGGLFLVGSSAQLPDDLAPCIVLDASAPLRQSYTHWARRTGKVEFLPSVAVSYPKLALHWWSTGANKSTLEKAPERAKVLGVVAAMINENPEERWLVIHPKEVRGCLIRDELETAMMHGNVEFLHWGLHLGRNEYRDIKNVIVIGCVHYGQLGYEALHAASTENLEAAAERNDISTLADGEFAHHVYQAACRSNLRNMVGGVAGDATVYLIALDMRKRRALLQQAFPGCTISDWLPVPPKPKRKEQRFMETVVRLFGDGRREVSTKELWQQCGAKDAKYLYPLWKKDTIKEFLKEQGLERRGNSLRRMVGRSPQKAGG